MLPTIHTNGTSRDDLVEQRTAILDLVREAAKAMQAAWPNGRDYYPQGPDALRKAQMIAMDRLSRLDDIYDEIKDEALAISNQEGA